MPTEYAASELLTVAEVAERFGVSPSAVVKWADDGKLPFVRTPGRHRRFRPADVDELYAATLGREAS